MRGIWVVLILVVVGVAAYIGIFKRDWFLSKVEEAKRKAKGYTAAKTYSEALDKFQKAIDDRDYEAAAFYCGGDIDRFAAAFEELGGLIIRRTIKTRLKRAP